MEVIGEVFDLEVFVLDVEVWYGFYGYVYEWVCGMLCVYDDWFDDYGIFLMLWFEEVWWLFVDDGMFYLYFDYCEVYYVKVMFDVVFGWDCFFNEFIWVYDYGVKLCCCWFIKYDMIFVYVKNLWEYVFNFDEVDWEFYMVLGLVMVEKVVCGKFFIDVWWYMIVLMIGWEKIGYLM